VHTLALGPLLLLLSGGLEGCKCQPGELVKFRAERSQPKDCIGTEKGTSTSKRTIVM